MTQFQCHGSSANHINALRGDGINPGLLGMSGTVSEHTVRLAMGRIDETTGLNRLSNQILDNISPALGLPWILDIDVTAKPPSTATSREPRLAAIPLKPDVPAASIQVVLLTSIREIL